jgi:ribosomal protein S18 acetylase RimI-like enzyme
VNTAETTLDGDLSIGAVSPRALSSHVIEESYRIMRQRFPATLFTRLGGFFFRTLIQRAVEHGKADLVVATNVAADSVVGFAVLVHTKSWIKETVRRYPAAFAMAAGAALVKPSVWLRLFSRLQSRFSKRGAEEPEPHPDLAELPETELYLIAVRPENEGQGCGRALMSGVEQSVRRAGSARYSVFTPVTNHRANRFYVEYGLSRIGHLEPLDMDMNVYVKDL